MWVERGGGNLIDILKLSSGTYLIFGVYMIFNFNIFIYKGPSRGCKHSHVYKSIYTYTREKELKIERKTDLNNH